MCWHTLLRLANGTHATKVGTACTADVQQRQLQEGLLRSATHLRSKLPKTRDEDPRCCQPAHQTVWERIMRRLAPFQAAAPIAAIDPKCPPVLLLLHLNAPYTQLPIIHSCLVVGEAARCHLDPTVLKEPRSPQAVLGDRKKQRSLQPIVQYYTRPEVR